MNTPTDPRATVERIIARLREETLKRGQVAAIKARVSGLSGHDLREALKTEAYYNQALNRAVLEFYRGDSDAGEFIDEMIRLIEGQFERAWNEGSRDVGVDPNDHTPEDDAVLQEHIDKETDFILDYAEAIEAARIAGDPVGPLQARVSLWANRYNEMVNAARMHFGAEREYLKWELGATEEHCETCAALDGIVATAEAWEESGFHPQGAPNDALACQGWRCDCSLEPTKEKPTEKQPSDVQAAKSLKGAPEGHEFYGNQWTGEGGGEETSISLAGGGSILGRTIGNTKGGAPIYEVNKFEDFHKTRSGIIAVSLRGQNRGSILYSPGAQAHSEIVDTFDSNDTIDNYVRYAWGRSDLTLTVDKYYAASEDPEKGLDNIYKSLDRLAAAGVPESTSVIITTDRAGGGAIVTTVKKLTIKSLRTKRLWRNCMACEMPLVYCQCGKETENGNKGL
jgi:hypothetical protein